MAKLQSDNQSNKIVVIVGPTASGKSDLAIKLAKKINGEIISADSRQVYRGMDIGTGKVPRDRFKIYDLRFTNGYFSKEVRHHLIDVANPKKQFTADDFKKLGQKALNDIASRSMVPIVVGGTGFYIDVLLGRMSIAEVPPSNLLRSDLNKFTAEQLFERLRRLDPRRAKTIEPKNKRRLIRALEIVLTTGKPVPRFKIYDLRFKNKYDVLWIGLKPKNIEQKIKKRLDARLKQGMVKEVVNLHKQDVSWKRLDDFGLEYRWISRYIRAISYKPKAISHNEFMRSQYYQDLLKSIIRYSKHQMTWFTQPHPWEKNNPKKIHWISSPLQASKLVKDF